jgi:hypothetical protein
MDRTMGQTIERIMTICGAMPNPAAHRHYLEQLPTRQLQQRLQDLQASEEHHAGRWVGGECRVNTLEVARADD